MYLLLLAGTFCVRLFLNSRRQNLSKHPSYAYQPPQDGDQGFPGLSRFEVIDGVWKLEIYSTTIIPHRRKV
jgi:hypothetical protein